MSFTTTMFDELVLELGELATMRDDALRRPEIAASPAVRDAVQALAEAVTAMARAALSDRGVPEVALARIALSRAQRLFCPVNAMLAGARAAEERSPTAAGSGGAVSLRMARSRTV
jgi:hypothetical protein